MYRPVSLPKLRMLPKRVTSVPLAGLLIIMSPSVPAQEIASGSGQARAVSIVPRVSLTETFTDNVRLAETGRESEQITEISPGIRITMQGARVKGYFDYALSGFFYAQNSSPSRTQNALSTVGSFEAVDNWAFVDFSGSISQQAVSAFGAPSFDHSAVNANRAEVSSYRISPYVRGRLGDIASYEARYSRSVTGSDATAASDVTSADAIVKITGDKAFGNLGWSADFSRQRIDYRPGRPTEADRFNLGLSYAISPQLSMFVNAGRESNNYTSLDKQSLNTHGLGASWAPSEVTRVFASRSRRSFGDAHNLSFEHRSARTVWRFSDSKDVSAIPNQLGVSSGSIYDLLFTQFASIEPDPAARAQLVNTFLQANGISPNAVVINSFLTSAVSLQRRQDLSFALLGVRDTITFVASRSENTRLDAVSSAVDDFNDSAVVRQRGFSVNYAHRLTPNHSLGVLVSQQRTSGVSNLQDIKFRFVNVGFSSKLGKRAATTVALRHSVSSGAIAPYTENAIAFSLNVQF